MYTFQAPKAPFSSKTKNRMLIYTPPQVYREPKIFEDKYGEDNLWYTKWICRALAALGVAVCLGFMLVMLMGLGIIRYKGEEVMMMSGLGSMSKSKVAGGVGNLTGRDAIGRSTIGDSGGFRTMGARRVLKVERGGRTGSADNGAESMVGPWEMRMNILWVIAGWLMMCFLGGFNLMI